MQCLLHGRRHHTRANEILRGGRQVRHQVVLRENLSGVFGVRQIGTSQQNHAKQHLVQVAALAHGIRNEIAIRRTCNGVKRYFVK
jgi:hypothetical protein